MTDDIKFLSQYWLLWFSNIKLYGEPPDCRNYICMEDYFLRVCHPTKHIPMLYWLSA